MKIYLWIRRTKEYYNMTVKNNNGIDKSYYLEHIDKPLQITKWAKRTENGLMTWRLFFEMPYLEFRKKMAEIAALTYEWNNFDGIFEYEDWDKLKSFKDVWILPIDEDDWLNPNCVKTLRSLDLDKIEVVRWKVYITDYKGIFQLDNEDFLFYQATRSCSYITRNINKDMINFDYAMDSFIKKNRKRVLDIDDYLSVKLDHLGSISCLRTFNAEFFVEQIRQHYLMQKTSFSEEYNHLIDLYNELYTELYKSFRLK